MNSVHDDEEDGGARIAGIDVSEIAALLAERTDERDAYDVLRGVLTTLAEQSRDRGRTTH